MKKQLLYFSILMIWLGTGWTVELHSHSHIHHAVMDFIHEKTTGLQGEVTIKVGEIDRRLALSVCSRVEVFLPAGAQLLGKTTIGVRCNEKNGWSLFVPVSITVKTNILMSSRPLLQGQTLGSEDVTVQTGELAQPGVVTDLNQINGKTLKFAINAGQLLKQEMFRAAFVVIQGQTVQLISGGSGFELRTEGVAVNNAAEGQRVQVRVSSGQVINGVAKGNGVVEVRK